MNQIKEMGWTPNKPRFINKGKPIWRTFTKRQNSLLVMRYLSAEAGSQKHYLEANDDDVTGWNLIDPTNRDVYESLVSKKLASWSSFDVAKVIITRSIKDLEAVGLIGVENVTGRYRIINVEGNREGNNKGNPRVTGGELEGNPRVTGGELEGNPFSDSTVELSHRTGLKGRQRKVKEGDEALAIAILCVKEDTQESLEILPKVNEVEDEVTIKKDFLLTKLCSSGVIKGKVCKSVLDLVIMKRDTEPKPFNPAFIERLESFILDQSEQHTFEGGKDNCDLNLGEWINNDLHTKLVAPNLNEKIDYQDFRDMPKTLQTFQTFKDFDWLPISGPREYNMILFPGLDNYAEYAAMSPDMISQPFNNPYLTPRSKGLAYIRMFPFGWHTRDTWVHPWSPPVIPWAVCADSKELMNAWNKEYWYQGYHPFAPDVTMEFLETAIKNGNKEVDNSLFSQEHYDSVENPPKIAGAKTSIISDPSSFQLLHWICGTIGVSPTVLWSAIEQAREYKGGFVGSNINHPDNKDLDKIRIFLNWLKLYAWGSTGRGAWLKREEGESRSLHSSLGQEWSHQGVLGGCSVLVKCHDGEMREAYMNEYQKKVYDLKFNPKDDRDKEILDSLLKEMV